MMKRVLTWPEIRRQFRKVVKDYPTLSAQWREIYRIWVLRPDLMRTASGDFSEASSLFKASAKAALSRLRKKSRHREAWQGWLDLLREHLESHGLGDQRSDLEVDTSPETRDNFGKPGRYTDCGAPIFVTYREWHLMQKSGDSLYVVRKRLGGSTKEVLLSDGLHLRHPSGRLAVDGVIACVPETSASFCLFLESSEAASNGTKRQEFMKPHIAPNPRKPTLAALAYRAGVEQSSLSRWYRGESHLSTANINRLAKYLNVDPTAIPN